MSREEESITVQSCPLTYVANSTSSMSDAFSHTGNIPFVLDKGLYVGRVCRKEGDLSILMTFCVGINTAQALSSTSNIDKRVGYTDKQKKKQAVTCHAQ